MQRRIVIPLVFGVIGTAILIGLGMWQVQRLAEKRAVLDRIDARIGDAPVALPADPDEAADEYLAVAAEGELLGPELHVLVGAKGLGAGYRVIQPFETGGRRILVDRGFIALEAKETVRPVGSARITGNLLWPDEVDSHTPPPDEVRAIWFARDLPAMAAALETEPLLLVVRDAGAQTAEGVTPLPVDSTAIPNDHLQYAITWFSLSLIWAGMTGYFLWRSRRAAEGAVT